MRGHQKGQGQGHEGAHQRPFRTCSGRTCATVLLSCLIDLPAAGCRSHPPAPTVYDFDAIEPPPASPARLSASITVPGLSAPSWLASTSVSYRLDYAPPSLLQSYARARWVAPPAELLTVRLRQVLAGANAGFTLARGGPAAGGYRLEVTMERLEQIYTAPQTSHGLVSFRATVTSARDGHVLAQRGFQAERPAASPDARSGVRALVEASDQCFGELMGWLAVALPGSRPP